MENMAKEKEKLEGGGQRMGREDERVMQWREENVGSIDIIFVTLTATQVTADKGDPVLSITLQTDAFLSQPNPTHSTLHRSEN